MSLRSLTPRLAAREVSLLLALLVLASGVAVGVAIFHSGQNLVATNRITEVNRNAATLFRASDGIQIERGRANNALLAARPASAEAMEAIAAPRRAAREAAGPALDALGAGAGPAL
ncbi:hypothetical protein, partial [Roseomonas sp. CECT 9278]|uniref:hypothetical protein n=1 Tax=Roseomonas sp. CECT 9278 TaxID=2845823 RepID=UPI001E2C089D